MTWIILHMIKLFLGWTSDHVVFYVDLSNATLANYMSISPKHLTPEFVSNRDGFMIQNVYVLHFWYACQTSSFPLLFDMMQWSERGVEVLVIPTSKHGTSRGARGCTTSKISNLPYLRLQGPTPVKESYLKTRGRAMSLSTLQFESLLTCTLGWGMHKLSPPLYANGALAWNNLVTAGDEHRLIGSVTARLIQIYVTE